MTTAGDRIRRAAAEPASRAPSPFRRPPSRATHPHRISLDLTDDQYNRLKTDAYEARVPAAALVRAALGLLAADERLLAKAVRAAQSEHPGPPTIPSAQGRKDERA